MCFEGCKGYFPINALLFFVFLRNTRLGHEKKVVVSNLGPTWYRGLYEVYWESFLPRPLADYFPVPRSKPQQRCALVANEHISGRQVRGDVTTAQESYTTHMQMGSSSTSKTYTKFAYRPSLQSSSRYTKSGERSLCRPN